ncbi:hypothetical protein [Burkholderia pyrrocinia]|uniref:hypothetical protein n=1 Tax=Burkholderia pyrrocinia TaxID=60550 RepID=UPI001260164D|nr:hypothetical protein [Burkholderia pyrrocinia]
MTPDVRRACAVAGRRNRGVLPSCYPAGASGMPTIRDTELPSLDGENKKAKSAFLFSGGTRNWL